MAQEFEIIKIFAHHNRGQFIFARHVNVDHDFEIKEGSLLGGIPVLNYLDMPRMLDDNGQPRLDVFVFRQLGSLPADYFHEGQVVKLVVPE